MSGTIAIDFEGERVAARAGESVAAALTAHGVLAFRTTREQAERGVFCGMGVCQDCLVEVDGRPNQRACMTRVDRPLVVRREAHARRPPEVGETFAPVTIGEVESRSPELLVLGAGPGGLSAAIAARRAGAEVLLVDEGGRPGGQYFKQLNAEAADVAPPDAQHREGASLIETAKRLGVDIRTGVSVWGAFDPGEFAATAEGRTLRLLPRATIVATGAYERGWPVPGWTLPGVMTTGAAQAMWRTARRLPGRRILIAGNGPLNLQLATELIGGGAQVVAVVEAAARPGLGQARLLAAMALAGPSLIRDGLRYHAVRRSGGAAMVYGMVVGAVEKVGNALSVRLAPVTGDAATRTYTVDALCLGYGFEPSNELLRVLGCGHDYDPIRRQLVTRRNPQGLTTVPNIYALGDCTGLGGARAALAEGTLVGLAAAVALGHVAPADLEAEGGRARTDLCRHRHFQRALWALYAAPPYSTNLATPETLICRCEEVTFGQIEEALSERVSLIGAVKRRTRVGMGRCQGRYCAPLLDALLAERSGRPREEFSGFAPRVPIRPVAIDDLTRLGPK
jgi:NADPH-dependent 2,4-dienoyl-CoA reductase/sulfur reductase-like enzyme